MAAKDIKKIKESPNNPQIIPGQPQKSPRNYRFITEVFLGSIGSLIVLGMILFVYLDLSHKYDEKRHLDAKRSEIQKKIYAWEQIASAYPNYPDGYFMVATLSYQIGDIKTAQGYLEKTLELDPNFKEAQTLEKIVQIRKMGE